MWHIQVCKAMIFVKIPEKRATRKTHKIHAGVADGRDTRRSAIHTHRSTMQEHHKRIRMRALLCFMLLCAIAEASGQQIDFDRAAATDTAALSRAMPSLAKQV